jgi:hypothetical protein
VQPALQALDAYLEHAEPYSDVHVFLFQHGTNSPRIARPAEFAEVINRHGARAHFDGWIRDAFRTTSARLAATAGYSINYHGARQPWTPMPVGDGLRRLADSELVHDDGLRIPA